MPIELEQLQIKPINSLTPHPAVAAAALTLRLELRIQLWEPLAMRCMKIKLLATMANKFYSNASQIAIDTRTDTRSLSLSPSLSHLHGHIRSRRMEQDPHRIAFVFLGKQINCQWVCTSVSRKVFRVFPLTLYRPEAVPLPNPGAVPRRAPESWLTQCDTQARATCILSLLWTQHNSRFLRWNKFPVT